MSIATQRRSTPERVSLPTQLDLGQLYDLQDILNRGIASLEADEHEAGEIEVGQMVLADVKGALQSLSNLTPVTSSTIR